MVTAEPMLPVTESSPLIDSAFEGVIETRQLGLSVLGPSRKRAFRRVIYVNAYGGSAILEQIRAGLLPPHHLWGCVELARKGYEVALADPLPDFYLHRNPLPHDLKLLQAVRSWLGDNGIVYCAHNVLYWLPMLRALGAIRCHIVSLLFAREPLKFSRAHSGVIALNRAAAEQARRLAPRAKVAHLGWGVDLSVFPVIPYHPRWFLSCGLTHRDHRTLSAAAAITSQRIRVISRTMPANVCWPPNVAVLTGTDGGDAVTYQELLREQYSRCTASLILLKNDPAEYTGVGMTSLIESMAMARPVIVTRTGALPTEVDVEKEGCGLFVPPNDPAAVADALNFIAEDPDRARRMGARGRQLCEAHYNIERYATQLDDFFATL